MAEGKKTNIIKVPSFIQSTIVAILSSCDTTLSQESQNFLCLLAVYQLFIKLNCSDAKLLKNF